MRGTGCVYRRKKDGCELVTWWIKYYDSRGRCHRESSYSPDRKKAEKMLKGRLAEIGAERLGLRRFLGPAGERFTVNEMIDDYVTAFCDRRGLRAEEIPPWMKTRLPYLRGFFGDMRAFNVDSGDITRYRKQRSSHRSRRDQPLAPTTINRELQILRAAFNIAVKKTRKLAIAPWIQLANESHNVRRGFFETPDFEATVENLPEELRDFARFAFWTGMRKSGVAALRWADVRMKERMLLLRPEDDKAGYGVPLKLPQYLWNIIERRWKERTIKTPQGGKVVEWIFHRNGFPVIYKSFDRLWKKALTSAGIEGRLFHDLRRTAVRNMRRAGVPQDVIMKIAGMKTDAIFLRYNIVDGSDIEAALEKTVLYVEAEKRERKIEPMSSANIE